MFFFLPTREALQFGMEGSFGKKTRMPRVRADLAWRPLAIRDIVSRCVQRDSNFPRLAHGLDRILFSPGVHYAACPRTHRFNYPAALERIPDVDEFDFTALPSFKSAANDEKLQRIGCEHGAKFLGSTSSMTGVLSHCYFALSKLRPVDTSPLSKEFLKEPNTFAKYLLMPTMIRLKRCPSATGRSMFAIIANDEFDAESTVLMFLGHVMERMLTMDPNVFNQFLTNQRDDNIPIRDLPNSYHYAQFDDFLIRSQIDCHHPELPNVTFDLKSRATIATRLDMGNYLVILLIYIFSIVSR